ncbi:hypothetical protein COX24_03520 [bacterium (Candidatus Gribaldobacteria) CG23_combo_of_CG06-09_8_20_14_all_37_87_8]|uniref:Methyltransferase type 11 domain-containing protein n=2 Tax=Candidatus Gribaldobacteria TaxID=2798536 RepID=A0A2G9ZE39_9BACT|nr:MAG: hypothetical protein AUJ25_00930 [Parcubacteria group bacterium CG1_02_37_13]PIP31449.1 MAG: hypothetical protein COX24_03520 [bacterium (Candidatus Gribaldobacteria) CG23_combo_of_CG06-09_8_20_14_all_37_87_8]PIR89977.1 MAG: hypothetical protein COU05_03690 [bacterium (Candidatus Gribaldobacteria) CG10_big_fil_rev_8_21_14_0_10_37_21]
MKQALAEKLLKQTRETYNTIAYNFSNTRNQIWQDLLPLLDYSRKGDKVLDLGCGNGRLFAALKGKQVEYTGCDNSKELIKIAKQKYPELNFKLTDGLVLPFKDKTFDLIYCIAVLHHIPSKALRISFLKEAKRVLHPNGLLIATVWKLSLKARKEAFLWFFQRVLGKTPLDLNDCFVSWQNKQQRYVHNFSKRELKTLFKGAGFKVKEVKVLAKEKGKNGKQNYNLSIIALKEK